MYVKRGEREQQAYFRFAPPMGEWTDDPQRRVLPFRGAQPHQCSVYYFWWAYLRENADYIACCETGGQGPMAELYSDFGDVRSDDFRAWWMSGGRELFCEPALEPVIIHDEPPVSFNRDTHVLVSIPVTADLDRTLLETKAKLKGVFGRAQVRGQSRLELSKSMARYPVAMLPVIDTLWRRLEIWTLMSRDPTADAYLVGVAVGLVADWDIQNPDADFRNEIRTIVMRNYREAKALIANVGEGRFPELKDNSPEALARIEVYKKRRAIREIRARQAADRGVDKIARPFGAKPVNPTPRSPR